MSDDKWEHYPVCFNRDVSPRKNTEEYTIKFYQGENEVGCFNYGVLPMTFTGDYDKAAHMFVKGIVKYISDKYVKAESVEQLLRSHNSYVANNDMIDVDQIMINLKAETL